MPVRHRQLRTLYTSNSGWKLVLACGGICFGQVVECKCTLRGLYDTKKGAERLRSLVSVTYHKTRRLGFTHEKHPFSSLAQEDGILWYKLMVRGTGAWLTVGEYPPLMLLLGMVFSNGASILLQYSVSTLNGSKYYLNYARPRPFMFLRFWTPGYLYPPPRAVPATIGFLHRRVIEYLAAPVIPEGARW